MGCERVEPVDLPSAAMTTSYRVSEEVKQGKEAGGACCLISVWLSVTIIINELEKLN